MLLWNEVLEALFTSFGEEMFDDPIVGRSQEANIGELSPTLPRRI